MIDLAKMTGIIDGKYQPLCKLAVSPQYAARGYNGAPNSTKASLNNIPVVDNYFDFSAGSSTSDNVNCGNLFFKAGEMFEITIDFEVSDNVTRPLQCDVVNKLRIDQYDGLRWFMQNDNGDGITHYAVYGDRKPLIIGERIISTLTVLPDRTYSVTTFNDGYHMYNNASISFTPDSFTFNNIYAGGINGFAGKMYNLYINKTKHYDPEKIKAIHKFLRGK